MKKLFLTLALAFIAPLAALGQGGTPPGGYNAAQSSGASAAGATNALGGLNAKGFGAIGNTQYVGNCTVSVGNPDINCTASVFKSTDVGLRANCNIPTNGTHFTPGSVILTFVSATHVKLNSNSTANNASDFCEWGTDDQTAFAALNTAWNANVKGIPGQPPTYQGIPTGPAVAYIPTSMYMVDSSTNGLFNLASSQQAGAAILGDAAAATQLISSDSPASAGNNGFFVGCASGATGLVIKNIQFNGFFIGGAASGLNLNCAHSTENLTVANMQSQGFTTSAPFGYELNLNTQQNNTGFGCNSCGGEVHFGGSSNNAAGNFFLSNVLAGNLGLGFRAVNYFVDECGIAAFCSGFINVQDFWSQGSVFTGTPSGAAVNCDATSTLHFDGGMVAVFGTDTNVNGLLESNGCRVNATDTRFVGSGAGFAVNNTGNTAGGFFDLGGNRIQMLVLGSSGTETASAATINTTTNPTTQCPVGGTVDAQGFVPAGYNGTNMPITANSATSITYTANVSGLGATTTGQLYCNYSPGNTVGYTGVLPIFPLSVGSLTQLGGQQVTQGVKPTFAVTGFGTSPTVTVQTGSTDIAGAVTITAGTAPAALGTFTLTFSRALGVNPAVCTFTLLNGTGSWNALAQEPIVQTPTTTSIIANWADNSVVLTAASTYGFNWSCYGK